MIHCSNINNSSPLPLSLLMSSAWVLPLDIHAMVRDSSTPMGTATIARRKAARISLTGSACSDMVISTCKPSYYMADTQLSVTR